VLDSVLNASQWRGEIETNQFYRYFIPEAHNPPPFLTTYNLPLS